jgi:hypothetical protein
MSGWRIIPLSLFFVATPIWMPRQDVARGQTPVEYAQPGPYLFRPPAEDCSQPKPIWIQPEGAWIQPATPAQVVPIMPLPDCSGPHPEMLPEPMFGTPAPALTPAPATVYPPVAAPTSAGPLSNIAPDGTISQQFGLPPAPEASAGLANPIFVPASDDQLAWEQITDVVSDYFTIAREQQVRRSGEAWSEGRIETAYQGGATWLEPFRKDSVGSFNRWESTFQTIRRSAVVRVMPDANGYLVEVVVQKEIEDLPHPERATAGAATFLNNESLPTQRAGDVSRTLSSPRWLPLGRDPALEARMLADIHARLNGVTTASSPSIWP